MGNEFKIEKLGGYSTKELKITKSSNGSYNILLNITESKINDKQGSELLSAVTITMTRGEARDLSKALADLADNLFFEELNKTFKKDSIDDNE